MTDQDIINLRSADPFADVTGFNQTESGATGGATAQRSSNIIHIRIQQRSGKKTLTTVQGIGEEFDKKRLLRAFKKKFACNGTVVDHKEYGEVIQLQGDQRTNVSQFLTETGICQTEQLKVHEIQMNSTMLTDEEATLYDRQIRLWGADAQLKLRQTRLLLINVNSLAIEVCKNLCLAGVASITIFDNTRVTSIDVEENLSLTMSSSDINELKSVCTCRVLQQLNPRVQLIAESNMTINQIDEKYIEQFDYVCLFNYYDFSAITHLNKLCRVQQQIDENGKKQVYFFCAGTFGLYGFVFKDLGDVYDYLSENSVGSESLIKGEGNNETKKNEKITMKSTRNFIPFEKALTDEWKPNRRQSTIRSAVTTYNLLRALLSFYEQYQRTPALATQETDIPNLMKIIRDKTSLSTASASSLNSDEFNEELLKDLLTDNNAVASIVGGIMSHDIVKVISKQEPKDNFFFFNGISCVGLSIPIAC